MAQHLVGLIYTTATGELLRMVQPGDDDELRWEEFCGAGESISVMQCEGAPGVRDAIDYISETTDFIPEEVCPAPMRAWMFPPPPSEEPEEPEAGE